MAKDPITDILLEMGKLRGHIFQEALRAAPSPLKTSLNDFDTMIGSFEEEIMGITGKTWDDSNDAAVALSEALSNLQRLPGSPDISRWLP